MRFRLAMKVLRAVWVTLAVALLLFSLYVFKFQDPRPNSDAGEILIYGMYLLSFPSGPGLVTVTALIMMMAGSRGVPESSLHLTQVWLLLAFAGYLQWFVLIPQAISWWKARRQSTTH